MRHGWTMLPVLGLLSVAALTGCHAFEDHRQGLARLAATGHYEQAAQVLDDPDTRALYDNSRVLWELDRGAVALALDQTGQAIDLLEQAERRIELRRERSLGDELASWAINDASAAYVAEPYEDMYLNVLKLLAQLEAGNISGGATVEARRLASKADLLRAEYLKYEEAMQSRSAGLGSARGLVSVNDAGRFLESPLGTYLSTIAFMKAGDREFQRVAGKRLTDSIRLQSGLVGPVQPDDFTGLAERDPGSVNVLAVALSGRAPTKYPERVGPIPIGTFPLYFELPKLHVHPSTVARARLEVRQAGSPDAAVRRLDLVEDLAQVAAINHERMLPLIYTRTLIRYAVKAGLATAATEIGRRQSSDQDQDLVQIAGAIAGLAFLMSTEKADLRSWVFLPGQAHVAGLKLTPGRHETRVVYESALGGEVYATPWRTVQVDDGDTALTTIVTHYWN